jgi:pimeloyl-ACP methyl ester carboxylesterase
MIMILVLTTTACGRQPVRSEDPLTLGRELVAQLASGDYSGAFNSFDSTMKSVLPKDVLKQAWESLLEQAGPYRGELEVKQEVGGKFTRITITSMFEKFPLNVQITLNPRKQVSGLYFQPAQGYGYTPPHYGDPASFREQDFKVTTHNWTLGGTLSLPVGEGPWPAVVLVHGSGPNDRDETIGGNKPFADLAWGLASRGIAVLRYDKRTYVYGQQMSSMPDITLYEETVEDAVSAVKLLADSPQIDKDRIYVLGHSLGGMAAPRIGKALPELAGLIMLAAPARPLEDLVLEQMAYLASLEEPTPELDAQISALERQVQTVKSPDLTPATSPTELPLGLSAVYWLDLRGYNPPALAAELAMRLLVLQGERDYQVTMEDFTIWHETLKDSPGAELVSYPGLNHLFIIGTGQSKPQEYLRAGNVAVEVIEDIAGWILDQ